MFTTSLLKLKGSEKHKRDERHMMTIKRTYNEDLNMNMYKMIKIFLTEITGTTSGDRQTY